MFRMNHGVNLKTKKTEENKTDYLRYNYSSCLQIVLDIDDTLAKRKSELSDLNWFQQRNLVIQAIQPHILRPGTLEFIRFLFSINNVRLSFFSAGDEKRNLLFVDELIMRACPDNYHSVRPEISVLSCEHLSYRCAGKGQFFGQYKKDLRKLLRLGETLESVVLIDDDPSYVEMEQIQNLLFGKCFHPSNFRDKSLQEGLSRDDFHNINHIFYITGLLKILLMELKGQPIVNHLRKLNPSLQFDRTFYEDYPEFKNKDYSNPLYVFIGLKELQKFNSDLNFFGSDFDIDQYIYKHIPGKNWIRDLDLVEQGGDEIGDEMLDFGNKLSSGAVNLRSLKRF